MQQTILRISELLGACGTTAAVLPPTALFNEGWMLRLVLDSYSRIVQLVSPLKPARGARWRSEVLLPSRFLATSRHDKLAEGWTHADAVVGHFSLKPGGRGDILLLPQATQLVVVEAKMFSPLSAGTRRAPSYNQAARNVACMAHVVAEAKLPLGNLEQFAFIVLAPREQLLLPEFADLVRRDAIAHAVLERVAAYQGLYDSWHVESFLPAHERMEIQAIAWEDAIADIAAAEPQHGAELHSFYDLCMQYNKPTAIQKSA